MGTAANNGIDIPTADPCVERKMLPSTLKPSSDVRDCIPTRSNLAAVEELCKAIPPLDQAPH